MRLLFIDKEVSRFRSIKDLVKSEHWKIDCVRTGEEGLFQATTTTFDVIILELELPDMPGVELCQQIRQKNVQTPILILSYQDSTEDKVVGLNSGADDYLTKPYRNEELLARLHALIRRNNRNKGAIITVKNVEMNTLTQEVFVSGEPIHLTPREFDLLKYLLTHDGEVITREEIIEHVWNEDPVAIMSNTVNVHMCALRKKVPSDLLRLQWNQGYAAALAPC